jgi:hypothetical protein
VCWLLDFAAHLPFAGLTLPRYFVEIGLCYFAIVASTVAIGFVLDRRSTSSG